MNIFAVDEDPQQAARDLCDKHVCKMGIEGTQLIATALHAHGLWGIGMPEPVANHNPKIVEWPQLSLDNLHWLILHTQELFWEYEDRYKRVHATKDRLRCCLRAVLLLWSKHGDSVSWRSHTPFVQSMPDEYKGPDAVEAYRRYYIGEKLRFAVWNHSRKPSWLPEVA